MDCLYTAIVLMDWGIDFKFILMDPSLLFALLTILLMCGFQERLFDISTSMRVATGTALSVSLCIVYGLSMGDFDPVMCIISHLEGLKVISKIVPSRLVSQGHAVGCLDY